MNLAKDVERRLSFFGGVANLTGAIGVVVFLIYLAPSSLSDAEIEQIADFWPDFLLYMAITVAARLDLHHAATLHSDRGLASQRRAGRCGDAGDGPALPAQLGARDSGPVAGRRDIFLRDHRDGERPVWPPPVRSA